MNRPGVNAIVSTVVVLILVVIGTWLIDPIYPNSDVTYFEGECISYEKVLDPFYNKAGHRRYDIHITLSDGVEYTLERPKAAFEVSPELVGSKVVVGSVEKYSVLGGKKTVFLSIDGVVLYDSDDMIKHHLQTLGGFSAAGAFVLLFLNFGNILLLIITVREKIRKKKKKKKRQLMKERRKLGWDHENKDN